MAFRRVGAYCVHCRTPLARVAADGHEHLRCPDCGATLVSAGDLAVIFACAQPRRTLELAIHNDGSLRHDCPVCGDKMQVTWIEFLRLESCELHGVWFEPGALDRLLAYDVLPEGLPNFRDKRKR